MKVLSVIVIALLLIQHVISTRRDDRQFSAKLEYIDKLTSIAAETITSIDPNNQEEKREMQLAAQNYINDTPVCIKFTNRGLTNNSRNNEHGETLKQLEQVTIQYQQWLENSLQKNNPNLQENLKAVVLNTKSLTPITRNILRNVKESSKNGELTVNAMADGMDCGFFVLLRTDIHLKNRKSSNAELLIKAKQILAQSINSIDKIPSNSYTINELNFYLNNLKIFTHKLSEKVRILVKKDPNIVAFKKAAEKFEKLDNDIQKKGGSKILFPMMLDLYKKWMNDIFKIVSDLPNNATEHTNELRLIIVDSVALELLFKNIIDILNGEF